MKDRVKPHRRSPRKLGFVTVSALCFIFFSVGFFGAKLFSQVDNGDVMESITDALVKELEWMPHGETGDGFVNSIPFQVLSWKPRALYFPNFATADQCESIVNSARPRLNPSKLALRKGDYADKSKVMMQKRTSSGVFMSAWEQDTLDYIEQKIAKVTMIPRDHGEAFNILRYEIGQKYDAHYDAFIPKYYGIRESQRLASFLLYLTDVEEGGETMFPYENGENMSPGYNYKDCIGLKVKPRRGDGLLFYSLFPNGTIDMTSLHGSCPVITGEKWVATKWLRNTTWSQF